MIWRDESLVGLGILLLILGGVIKVFAHSRNRNGPIVLSNQEAAIRKCSNPGCNHTNSPKARFCSGCGSEL